MTEIQMTDAMDFDRGNLIDINPDARRRRWWSRPDVVSEVDRAAGEITIKPAPLWVWAICAWNALWSRVRQRVGR